LELKLPVLQGVYQAFYDSKALRDFGPVCGSNFEVPVRLEFLRTLAERVSQTFTKLQLGLALRRITIGESLLADVTDRSHHLLKFRNATRDLFDESSVRSGPLLFRRACSCHGCVKKV
jgi:hypothetical protein